jgi:hypothetical protein
MSTAEERNEKVRAVLKAAIAPMTPSQIAEQIKEDWCWSRWGSNTAAISPICKRIGAVAVRRGQWVLTSGAA